MILDQSKLKALSVAQQDYLKAIFNLEERGKVSTQILARYLSVQPASVTVMLKKLARLGLIEYTPYRSIRLTEAGKRAALEIIRHHRLLETFLLTILGYSWDEVHEEAERLEHHISEEFEAKIAEILGHPDRDPHGDPIPTPELRLLSTQARNLRLSEAAPGDYLVVRTLNQDPDALRALTQLSLVPGERIRVISNNGWDVRIETRIGRILIPINLANDIELESLHDESEAQPHDS